MRTDEQMHVEPREGLRGPQTQNLRLPAVAIEMIRRTIRDVFPGRTEIVIFGSRTDPKARGADLDLLVIAHAAREVLARARIRAIALLQLALGDQHIDLVVTSDPEHDVRLVVREALRTGVAL